VCDVTAFMSLFNLSIRFTATDTSKHKEKEIDHIVIEFIGVFG
jgi:hypothetical protein